MLLTEEEYRKKWCPHARACASKTDELGSPSDVGFNRVYLYEEDSYSKNPEVCRCIASDCSQWRWSDSMPGVKTDKGFCGLAGKP